MRCFEARFRGGAFELIDWKSMDELECRVCGQKIAVEGLNHREMQELLKSREWSAVVEAPACPNHKNVPTEEVRPQ